MYFLIVFLTRKHQQNIPRCPFILFLSPISQFEIADQHQPHIASSFDWKFSQKPSLFPQNTIWIINLKFNNTKLCGIQ